MVIVPSKRPETYSELVARSFRLYSQTLRNTFIFALLVSIIIFIPRLLCLAIGQSVCLNARHWNSQFLLFVASYISILWFLATILWCINCIERNKHETYIADLKMAAKRMGYVLGAALLLFLLGLVVTIISYFVHTTFMHWKLYNYDTYLSAILIFAVLLLQVGVSLVITTLFYFYFPLIVVENDGILFALKKSAKVVWKNIGRTLALQLTPWLVYLLVLILIRVVFKINFNIYFLPRNFPLSIYPILLHIFILALFIPWSSSMMLVQLRDLELRKGASVNKNVAVK